MRAGRWRGQLIEGSPTTNNTQTLIRNAQILELLKIKILCNPTSASDKSKKKAKVEKLTRTEHSTVDFATAASFDKSGHSIFVTTRDSVVVFGDEGEG